MFLASSTERPVCAVKVEVGFIADGANELVNNILHIPAVSFGYFINVEQIWQFLCTGIFALKDFDRLIVRKIQKLTKSLVPNGFVKIIEKKCQDDVSVECCLCHSY